MTVDVNLCNKDQKLNIRERDDNILLFWIKILTKNAQKQQFHTI